MVQKIKSGVSELSMLLSWALENGIQTADSMKARGYGVAKRSSYMIYDWHRQDVSFFVIFVFLFLGTIYGIYSGAFYASYNPEIDVAFYGIHKKESIFYVLWLCCCMLPTLQKVMYKIHLDYAINKNRVVEGGYEK